MDNEIIEKIKNCMLNIMTETIKMRDIIEEEYVKNCNASSSNDRLNEILSSVKKEQKPRKPRKTKNNKVLIDTDLNLEV
jgi:hypothetical protein